MTDRRNDICATWQKLANRQADVHYTQDQRRDDWLTLVPKIKDGSWKEIWTDCSGAYELGYRVNDCRDPSNLAYAYLGFTGTLLASGRHIAQADTLRGDAMVCGPGTGTHVVGLMEPGTANGGNPLVFSHGHEQGISPEIRRLSYDLRMPRTYLRFDTDDHKIVPVPPKPTPKPSAPTPQALAYCKANGMVVIDVAEAKVAIHNAISYYTWQNGKMVGSRSAVIPLTVPLFAFRQNLDDAHIPHAGP